MLTHLGRTTPVSIVLHMHLVTVWQISLCRSSDTMLHRNIISTQPVLHSVLPDSYTNGTTQFFWVGLQRKNTIWLYIPKCCFLCILCVSFYNYSSVYKYIHVCTCVYMCIHVCTCLYMSVHVYTCVYMCIHGYTCVYMCIHVYTCVYMCIHVYTCVYMRHLCMHAYMCINLTYRNNTAWFVWLLLHQLCISEIYLLPIWVALDNQLILSVTLCLCHSQNYMCNSCQALL